MPHFLLDKWYLDVVTPDGRGVILYHAQLEWRGLSIRYAESMQFDLNGMHARQTTLRAGEGPCTQHGNVCWNEPSLGLEGMWSDHRTGMNETLLENGNGRIDWEVVAPAAACTVRTPEGQLAGMGYVERLRMTLPPWKLDVQEVRWGRAIAPEFWVVWISWRGGIDRTWVASHRGPARFALIAGDSVEAAGLRAEWQGETVIRDHALAQSLDGVASVLRPFIPDSILHAHERKLLSPVTISDAGTRQSGWAVHEVVQLGRGER